MSKLILHAIVTTTRSQLTNKVWDVNEIWSLQHDFMLNNPYEINLYNLALCVDTNHNHVTLGGHIVYMCPSYLRSAWGQMMLLGPQINYALQKSCDCPINQGLVVQMLDSGIYLIICYPADKRQGKTNNCVDYVCLMDSDSSSV